MSLKSELKKLKAQKKEELRTLHYVYVHTKRDAARTMNPARVIRKHLGVSIGVAALLGLFFAPRPGPGKRKGEAKAGGGSMMGHFSEALKNIGRLVGVSPPKDANGQAVPGAAEPSAPASAFFNAKTGKATKTSGLIGTLLALVLSKVDVAKIVAQLTQQYMQMKSKSAGQNGKHAEPRVTVADAGSVKPGDYENFQ